MALTLPSYPNPFDPQNPLENAYTWLSGVYLDLGHGSGRAVFNIHPSEAAWQAPPIGQVSISLGQPGYPTLAELMADEEFASAYAVVGKKLYQAALALPEFSGAIQV